jgi:hypothetical protein
MQKHEKPAFAAFIGDVMGYYGKDSSKFLVNLWWSACEGFELEQVKTAMQAHMVDAERGQFAPKVADLSRILQGTTTDRAALAWGKTYDAMQRVGAYQDVIFDDPAIHATIEDLGGWSKLCRMDLNELSYLQHRFATAYKAYSGRPEFDYPRKLNGDRSPDAEYERRGIALPKPALVGNSERCKTVYELGGIGGKTAITYADRTAITEIIAGALK